MRGFWNCWKSCKGYRPHIANKMGIGHEANRACKKKDSEQSHFLGFRVFSPVIIGTAGKSDYSPVLPAVWDFMRLPLTGIPPSLYKRLVFCILSGLSGSLSLLRVAPAWNLPIFLRLIYRGVLIHNLQEAPADHLYGFCGISRGTCQLLS